ncbi:OprD family outer membrane porin [Nitratiruptor sp. YY09-18]|uniref:OprD family outer membrane porin n=1 Tax=Nitratiruptor sp. YY09-18 TaxID=2724901 RepID=UPI001915FC80|nr:OprD family outer membrane porin [Nitratiruptor sp. YY09-18]BCD68021.1 hypothetical protein NitYY0918_C0930 [Nitratiruptor sp. YY09-18]
MKKSLIVAGLLLTIDTFSYAQSLRYKLTQLDLIDHANFETRLGYIAHNYSQDPDTKAFGTAGHFHLTTVQWNGLQADLGIYGATKLGKNEDPDFFGNKSSFVFFSEATLGYRYQDFSIEGGRFIFDSPHADSDDIRMVPNFFQGVKAAYSQNDTTLQVGYLTKMAGWESGGRIDKFKKFHRVAQSDKSIDGVFFAGFDFDSLSLWLYHIDNSANVMYIEKYFSVVGLDLRLQGDFAKDCEEAALGEIDAKTLGILVEKSYENLNFSFAYNKNYGNSGAMMSFGGGPFFTSMEDLTIDALNGSDQEAYTYGISYGKDNFSLGIMQGRFYGENFHSDEIDLYAAYSYKDISFEAVYASIDDHYNQDYSIVRFFAKYEF